jgi:hypothetical protein
MAPHLPDLPTLHVVLPRPSIYAIVAEISSSIIAGGLLSPTDGDEEKEEEKTCEVRNEKSCRRGRDGPLLHGHRRGETHTGRQKVGNAPTALIMRKQAKETDMMMGRPPVD